MMNAEYAAMEVLALVADIPGQVARLRAARWLSGQSKTPHMEIPLPESRYHAIRDWEPRAVVELIDAMLDGGLLTESAGARPQLCLTRAGWRALIALEA